MNNKLWLFAGGMGAGKDTLRKTLIQKLNIKKEFHFSFALPLKQEANNILKDLINKKNILVMANDLNVSVDELYKGIELLDFIWERKPDVTSYDRVPEIRAFLQYWGTDVRRKQDLNYWVNIAKEIISEKLNEGYTVIITDGRFYNEFDLINDLGGVTIGIKVSEETRVKRIQERDNLTPSYDALNHLSEQDWKTYNNFTWEILDEGKYTPEELLDIFVLSHYK